jgi:hypothetical protein
MPRPPTFQLKGENSNLWGIAQLLAIDTCPGDVSWIIRDGIHSRMSEFPMLTRLLQLALPLVQWDMVSLRHPHKFIHGFTLVRNTSGTFGPSSSTCAATRRSRLRLVDNSNSLDLESCYVSRGHNFPLIKVPCARNAPRLRTVIPTPIYKRKGLSSRPRLYSHHQYQRIRVS